MTKALFGTTFSLFYTHTSLRMYRDFGDSFDHFTSVHYQREVTSADVNYTDFLSVSQGCKELVSSPYYTIYDHSWL